MRGGSSREYRGAEKGATREFSGRGALQRWPQGLRAGATQGAPRSSRQSAGVAVMAACHSHAAEPPHRAFFRAPPFISKCVEMRHRSTPHKTAGGSASPQGEARRKAPPRQSEANAAPGRKDYGWGWAGGVTKPKHAPSPPTTPTTSHHTRGNLTPSCPAARRSPPALSRCHPRVVSPPPAFPRSRSRES